MSVVAAPSHAGSASRSRTARLFLRNKVMMAGAIWIALVALASLLAPWLPLFDPIEMNPVNRLKPPSFAHPFGTDSFGRDVFSRAIHGGRISLVVGLGVAVLSTIFGLSIGIVSGFYRHVDAVIMRVMDAIMSIPSILLAIALDDFASLDDATRFDAHLALGGGLDPSWLDRFAEAIRSVTGAAGPGPFTAACEPIAGPSDIGERTVERVERAWLRAVAHLGDTKLDAVAGRWVELLDADFGEPLEAEAWRAVVRTLADRMSAHAHRTYVAAATVEAASHGRAQVRAAGDGVALIDVVRPHAAHQELLHERLHHHGVVVHMLEED